MKKEVSILNLILIALIIFGCNADNTSELLLLKVNTEKFNTQMGFEHGVRNQNVDCADKEYCAQTGSRYFHDSESPVATDGIEIALEFYIDFGHAECDMVADKFECYKRNNSEFLKLIIQIGLAEFIFNHYNYFGIKFEIRGVNNRDFSKRTNQTSRGTDCDNNFRPSNLYWVHRLRQHVPKRRMAIDVLFSKERRLFPMYYDNCVEMFYPIKRFAHTTTFLHEMSHAMVLPHYGCADTVLNVPNVKQLSLLGTNITYAGTERRYYLTAGQIIYSLLNKESVIYNGRASVLRDEYRFYSNNAKNNSLQSAKFRDLPPNSYKELKQYLRERQLKFKGNAVQKAINLFDKEVSTHYILKKMQRLNAVDYLNGEDYRQYFDNYKTGLQEYKENLRSDLGIILTNDELEPKIRVQIEGLSNWLLLESE